jgi:hypothetical protein
MSAFVNDMVATLIAYGTLNLITIMIIVFFIALILKLLLYYLLKCEFNLSSAFETRTHRYLNNRYAEGKKLSKFHEVVEFILRKTYNEMYVTRKKQLRKRKMDPSVAVLNRMFLVEDGARSLIDDTLRQTKYHDRGRTPDFKNISKFVFTSNPYFTRLWGFIPIGVMNSVLNVLPSLFIIGGIFGTFLGISKGLPALKTIDPGDIAAAQLTLSNFLESMTFAMNSSVVGIFLSVCFTIVNAFLSLNTTYLGLVDKFTQSLELIWKETSVQGAV